MNTDAVQTFRILENVIFLKKTPLFSSVQTGELRAIAAIIEELTFPLGAEIVREQDVGDAMFLIKEGIVIISKKVGPEKTVELARLSTGACFGDMAVIDAEVRSASVTTETPCTLLRLKRDDLMDVIVEYPNIAIELLKIFVKRLRDANGTIQKLSTDA